MNPFEAYLSNTKQAWSMSPEGHQLDATHARIQANAIEQQQAAEKEYANQAPLKATWMRMDPSKMFRQEMTKRREGYTARQHERGNNAYNPLGGILTPYQSKAAEDVLARYDLSKAAAMPGFLGALATAGRAGLGAAQSAGGGMGMLQHAGSMLSGGARAFQGAGGVGALGKTLGAGALGAAGLYGAGKAIGAGMNSMRPQQPSPYGTR